MANPYPEGQCTFGAAEMCPCLGNTSQYGNFGDGGNWYSHAQQIGLPTSPGPVAGWLASFDVYPPYGDVGLVLSVNNDGTLTRYGMNWHLDGAMTIDKVPTNLVIGSFEPPCACTGPDGRMVTQLLATSSGQCHTFTWSLFGGTICFDGALAVVAMVGGLALLVTGLVLVAVWTARKTAGGRVAVQSANVTAQATQRAAQPVRRAPTGKRSPAESAASQQRVRTARVRAATRQRGTPTRRTTTARVASREQAMQALRENRQLSPEEARAIGATEVPKE